VQHNKHATSRPTNLIPPHTIVRIAVKNDAGAVSGEREFITYAGLLAVAHELGLDEIATTVLQMPTDTNGQTAVVRAIARGKPGLFTGLGDASPQNVGKRVAKHLLRVAETRAKARALRDLCNIHMLSLEELGEEEDLAIPAAQHTPDRRYAAQPTNVTPMLATDAQKRALWRKAQALGHRGDAANAFIAHRLGCALDVASRRDVSRLLDVLSDEERVPGARHAAE
jgi:hypothetical protein